MLTTSTPETVNPVADACEAAGVPCLSTVDAVGGVVLRPRRQAGRAVAVQVDATTSASASTSSPRPTSRMWTAGARPTRRSASCSRTTPTATRSAPRSARCSRRPATPSSTRAPTRTARPTTRRRSRSSSRRAVEIFNTFPIPPDFATFWRQAAQQGYTRRSRSRRSRRPACSRHRSRRSAASATTSRARLLARRRSRTSRRCRASRAKQLADGYEKATKQAVEPAARRRASRCSTSASRRSQERAREPEEQGRGRQALRTLKANTTVGRGRLHQAGRCRTSSPTPIIGGQWVKATTGTFKLDFVIAEHADRQERADRREAEAVHAHEPRRS